MKQMSRTLYDSVRYLSSDLDSPEITFAAQYLFNYYAPFPFNSITHDSVQNLVKTFQTNFGIVSDGIIDDKTIRAMEYPRCGVTDALPLILALSQWKNKRKLFYFFGSYLSALTKTSQQDMFHTAVNSWSSICGLTFDISPTISNADIVINASKLRREEFGQRGGVLAWAELPQGSDLQLQMKIDDVEPWVDIPNKSGIYYQAVVAHELGHSIGIGHLNQQSQLMNAFYNAAIFTPQEHDIVEAKSRYGISAIQPGPIPEAEVNFVIKAKNIEVEGYTLIKNV